jgi:hypothetical protein
MTRAQAEALMAYVDAAVQLGAGSGAWKEAADRRERVLATCDDGPLPGAEEEGPGPAEPPRT